MKSNIFHIALLAGLFAVPGCEELDQAGGNAEAPPAAATPMQQLILAPDTTQPAPATTSTPAPAPTVTSTMPAPDATPAAQPDQHSAPGVEKATAGVGKQGQGYGGGIVTTPVREYFIGRQRIVFDIQIPHEMQLYKALNGRYPRDYAEFESAILKPAAIELPELPADRKYLYDPKTGELQVGPADPQ